jgi:D-3-phosphoglycerate dehydrogenase
MRIIVTERIADEGIQYLRQNGFEVDVKLGLSHKDLLGIIDQYDAIIVRSVTKVNKELVEKGTHLKVAGRAGNGIDNIDVPACTQKGIIVVNTPESNIMAAGELAIALAYCLFRNVPQANQISEEISISEKNLMEESLAL